LATFCFDFDGDVEREARHPHGRARVLRSFAAIEIDDEIAEAFQNRGMAVIRRLSIDHPEGPQPALHLVEITESFLQARKH